MAKWLTTARGVRRTRPLSSISRCTTTLGNRCAPKRRVGSLTPGQDDGRETCHLGCCSIPACRYLNRATRRHTRFCGNKSRRASAERAVLIASSQRKERIESLSRQARLKSWIEPFRGVMQKPRSRKISSRWIRQGYATPYRNGGGLSGVELCLSTRSGSFCSPKLDERIIVSVQRPGAGEAQSQILRSASRTDLNPLSLDGVNSRNGILAR
jgi:hypothetical protein